MKKVITNSIDFGFHPGVSLDIRREDLIHPYISGNKYHKLKYNIEEAKQSRATTLITFGGAYSNHILATAYAGKLHKFNTVGIIRGEEVRTMVDNNPTLSLAKSFGMKFEFISRELYRQKHTWGFLKGLYKRYPNSSIIPEGGTNELAIKGCEEILKTDDLKYDVICTSVGTGGTMAGLIRSCDPNQKVVGFSSLKGEGLREDISKFVSSKNWELNYSYHFGGYAKINDELIAFINAFKLEFGIQLDPIYTGKMIYGIHDLLTNNYFPTGTKLLAIHTGGLQGIEGMNQRLRTLNKPQINA